MNKVVVSENGNVKTYSINGQVLVQTAQKGSVLAAIYIDKIFYKPNTIYPSWFPCEQAVEEFIEKFIKELK